MIFKRNASDFMTANVIVAGENNSFEQVMTFFTVHKIQHLPVAENNKLIGIVSMKDILSFIAHQLNDNPMISKEMLNNNFSIKEVMTAEPVTVEPESTQKEILEILAAGKFQAVPVVKGGIIKGIITNKDITRIYHYDATHLI